MTRAGGPARTVPSTMQDDVPLSVPAILRHALALHSEVDVSAVEDGLVRHERLGEVAHRAHLLAGALAAYGIGDGDRVATFLWNTRAHLEAYFGIPGAGAVLHTINLRLFPEQIAQIIDDAQDVALLVDGSLWDTLAPVLPERASLRLVVLTGWGGPLPEVAAGVDVVGYEDFLGGARALVRDVVDERAPAAMCYTSGTTGAPKGVVYSHRSVWLHAMANLTAAGFAIGESDRLLQVVPMFHANGWGFPYAAWLGGASLLLPDRHLAPEVLAPLIAAERPTVSGGVPTVWRGVFDHAREHGLDLTSLRIISCAGSAVPESLIRDYTSLGIDLCQAWGMTETSPLAAIARPPVVDRGRDEWYWRTRTGRPVPGVEVRTVGEDGAVLPRDGESVGELEVRGPWVTGSYAGGLGAEKFDDGWLRTGDMGTVDDAGAMKITDRLKDLIKSGGEWISSTEVEDHLSAHPGVLEAACIGIPDPRWEERPLAVVRIRPDTVAEVTGASLRSHLRGRMAKWQIPDQWVVVDLIPRTGVGKIDKQELRRLFAAGDLAPRPMT